MSFAIGSNYQAKCYFSRLKRIYLRSFLSSSVTNRTNVIVSGFEKEKRKNLAILIFIRQSTCSNLLSIFCPSRFMIQSSIAMWNKGNWLGLAIFHFFFIYIRRRSLRPIAFPFFFFFVFFDRNKFMFPSVSTRMVQSNWLEIYCPFFFCKKIHISFSWLLLHPNNNNGKWKRTLHF